MPVSACNTSSQTVASHARAVSGSIATLEHRRLGLLRSPTGFQLRRPMLFVLFLIVISPTVVLSSRQSVLPFSLRSGRKFRGCSVFPRCHRSDLHFTVRSNQPGPPSHKRYLGRPR